MSVSAASFEYIQQLVRRRAAVVLEANKTYLVRARLMPIVIRHGLGSIDELVAALHHPRHSDIIEEVVDAMTTKETSFFRDTTPFTALRREIFPRLFQRRAGQRRVTVWSAACATGQEPYSIAMLLRDHFPRQLSNVRLLATDLSRTALRQAEAGTYNDLEMSRGLTPELQERHFRRNGRDWVIGDEVRTMVEFRHLNLAVQWPELPRMDVILLRNVMVYFETATKKLVLRRARDHMWPDGYLILGGAETTLHLDDSFVRVAKEDFSFFQLRGEVERKVLSPV